MSSENHDRAGSNMLDPAPGMPRTVLLTGATGYIGGRLIKRLEDSPHRLRCMARRPENLRERVGVDTEVVFGDVHEPSTLDAPLDGIHTAFYLIRAIGETRAVRARGLAAAWNFGVAAKAAGVRRIIYLGGLGHGDRLPRHLARLQEIGRVLQASGVPTLEFRTSIVIGSGSLAFELFRSLVNRHPFMVVPKWVRCRIQPIAIDDVIAYLMRAIDLEVDGSQIYEIGGSDVVTPAFLIREYARQRGLRQRPIVLIPVSTPTLSSLWLAMITPLYARVVRKLIDSMRGESVVCDNTALDVFDVRPHCTVEAISLAIRNEERDFAETRWSDSVSSQGGLESWEGTRFHRRLIDSREVTVPYSAEQAFRPIRRIGGPQGYYCASWLWRVRGLIDLVVGGVGIRRGRVHPEHVRVGDTLDWWRVEEVVPDRLLRLNAEMRIPGRAWLQFEVTPNAHGSRIRQTAVFDPLGIAGLVYWYGILPIHAVIFRQMVRGLAAEVGRLAESDTRNQPEAGPDDGADHARDDHEASTDRSSMR